MAVSIPELRLCPDDQTRALLLTRRYARHVAVRNIAFEVGKGEIVGFPGKNGAGKTTTMLVLTCFLPPTAGKAS